MKLVKKLILIAVLTSATLLIAGFCREQLDWDVELAVGDYQIHGDDDLFIDDLWAAELRYERCLNRTGESD